MGTRAPAGSRRLPTWIALTLVIVTGINIRAIFGVTPPLIPEISTDLSINATTAGLVTSVPILSMAAGAPLGAILSQRFGTDLAMITLLLTLGLAEASRLALDTAVALILTAGGIGVALGALSTLSPALITHYLPRMRGVGTAVYVTAMALGVGLAAGTAQPLTDLLGGWRPALAAWSLLAWLLAAALYVAREAGAGMPPASAGRERARLPLREGRAWFLTAAYSVAMFLGFGVMAWLPSLFIAEGVDPGTAALYLVAFQVVQLFSILTLTPLTDRYDGRRGVYATAMLCSTAGLALLTFDPHHLAIPGLLLAGAGIGASSSLALVKVQDEARSPEDATRLSSMTMLFSFLAGAAGPFLLGVLKDATGSLTPGFALCLCVSASSLLLLIRMRPGDRSRHDDPVPLTAVVPE